MDTSQTPHLASRGGGCETFGETNPTSKLALVPLDPENFERDPGGREWGLDSDLCTEDGMLQFCANFGPKTPLLLASKHENIGEGSTEMYGYVEEVGENTHGNPRKMSPSSTKKHERENCSSDSELSPKRSNLEGGVMDENDPNMASDEQFSVDPPPYLEDENMAFI